MVSHLGYAPMLHLAGDGQVDATLFGRDTLSALCMPEELAKRHRTRQFSHIFPATVMCAVLQLSVGQHADG